MRVLGLDGGIASIGWAVLDLDETVRIVGCGTRMFDAPETDKERTPTNALRRLYRGQRRVTRRRRQRMGRLRQLFEAHGLLGSAGRDVLRIPGMDPWSLRAAGLERELTPAEFAVALCELLCSASSLLQARFSIVCACTLNCLPIECKHQPNARCLRE